MADATKTTRFRFWLWLIRMIGVIVPSRLRADWRQEWEAEFLHREEMLAQWDRLDWGAKLDLLRRSTSAFWDALWLQPKRLEDEMLQDLRFGLRMLLKNPGFTLIAVFTLALGIGVNTTVFTYVNFVLFRALTFVEPERVAFVWAIGPARGDRQEPVSQPEFEEWRGQSQSFETMVGVTERERALTGEGVPERVSSAAVSANYFQMLGVKPHKGRWFLPDEDRPDATHALKDSRRPPPATSASPGRALSEATISTPSRFRLSAGAFSLTAMVAIRLQWLSSTRRWRAIIGRTRIRSASASLLTAGMDDRSGARSSASSEMSDIWVWIGD
jgi:hypothetical protein